MTERPSHDLESRLTAAGRALPYPSTPDIARAVTHRLEALPARRPAKASVRRMAWVLVIVITLLSGLLAVPPVRAQILEFLQIGVIRIFLTEPTPTLTIPAISTPGSEVIPSPGISMISPTPANTTTTEIIPSPTPRPSPTPIASLLDLTGETSLAKAQRVANFPIRLPAYPPDLGQPDHVFLQDMQGQVLVLVWLDPADPLRIRLSLHQYVGKNNITGIKYSPPVVQETSVNGQPAVWAEGPYLLKLTNGAYQLVRLIEGHVLIWAQADITYRLETDLPLAEAVRIAESLQPPPAPAP